MSNYRVRRRNPATGKIEDADMLDDYFGKHEYGVRFSGGSVYHAEDMRTWPREFCDYCGDPCGESDSRICDNCFEAFFVEPYKGEFDE